MDVNYPDGDNQMPKLPPIKLGPWVGPVIILLFALSGVGTLFFQVDKDEAGVVQRFGKYVRTTAPGLHFKIPFGIETVNPIKTTHIRNADFGFRQGTSGGQSYYVSGETAAASARVRRSGYGQQMANAMVQESLMLTGDLNVAVVEWTVQYDVIDPVLYAFKIRNQEETVRDLSEAVIRLVVGDRSIHDVVKSGRDDIEAEAKEKLQQILDSYQSGVHIVEVILQESNPPAEVRPSWNEVNEARQQKEKLINQAWEEYNRVIPRAKGEAEKMIRNAEGYAMERTNRAQGDASRFTAMLKAYKTAPEVTKKRLYLEMAGKVMPDLKEKYFFDESQKSILPLMQLNAFEGGQES